MQQTKSMAPAGALRRALAVAEFAIAGLFLLWGVDSLTTDPRRKVGGDGIATGLLVGMAMPCLLIGVGLVVGAYRAWRGGRRWWIWQAVLPAWALAGVVAMLIHLKLLYP